MAGFPADNPFIQRLRTAQERAAAGDAETAQAMLRDLADAAADWDEPRLCLAQSLRAARETEAAMAAYETVLDINPTRREALLGLAALLMASGQQLDRAQLLLLRCCGIDSNSAEAWDALGVSLLLTGDSGAAQSAFAEAQRLAPDVIDYALHRAESALAAGTADTELARLAAAVEQDPLDVASLTARGLLLEKSGRREDAADILETAVALRPDSAPPSLLLGRILANLNRPAQAEARLAHAIALNPEDPQPRNDRAVTLLRLQRAVEARSILLELLEQHPKDTVIRCNLANALTALGDQDEAVRNAETAIALAPDAHLPWRTLCNAMPYRQGVVGSALLEALRACADRLPRAAEPNWLNAPNPDRRLRIGLLSGTLKMHPVGWLTVAGFEALDPNRFELVALAQQSADDSVARRFRSIAREWHDVSALSDAALAAYARDLAIDVVIDLGGYGEAGRMIACALRLAPVQVKWVGMQNHSSGLPEMDWFITDRWETPPGLERLYVERLMRLPDGYICYSPPADAPHVASLPMLDSGFVTFGCFNNLAKITPTVIDTWAIVLRSLPAARLVLKSHPFADPPTRDRLHAAFLAHGIPPERIELQGGAPHRLFLAEYSRIDIVLDPFPYSGGLTTCEALWMGVPVVTLPGEIFASRHSMSHLCNVGLQDWVAADLGDYVELALRKASDPIGLAALRADLRARVLASPLCDGLRFGRGLGEALRGAWQEWCGHPDRHA